jgi:hypothetical protein
MRRFCGHFWSYLAEKDNPSVVQEHTNLPKVLMPKIFHLI